MATIFCWVARAMTPCRAGTATIRLGGGVGADQLNGGGGQDLAIYFHPTEGDANVVGPINVQLAAGTVTTVDNLDTLRSIERVVGTNSDDIFNATGFGASSINAGSIGVGAASDGTLNEFEGLGGNDFVTGNGNTRVSYEHALAGVTVIFSASTGDRAPSDRRRICRHRYDFGAVSTACAAPTLLTTSREATTRAGPQSFLKVAAATTSLMAEAAWTLRSTAMKPPAINIQLAAGTVVVGPATQTDTLRSIEWISATDFVDVFNATGFTTTNINGPNFGSAGVNGSGQAFNRFEGRGANDTITGNGNTQISFDNATRRRDRSLRPGAWSRTLAWHRTR